MALVDAPPSPLTSPRRVSARRSLREGVLGGLSGLVVNDFKRSTARTLTGAADDGELLSEAVASSGSSMAVDRFVKDEAALKTVGAVNLVFPDWGVSAAATFSDSAVGNSDDNV